MTKSKYCLNNKRNVKESLQSKANIEVKKTLQQSKINMEIDKDEKNEQISYNSLTISHLFPSIATIIGLCVGLSSIKYGLDGRWELSVSLLVIAAIIDGMDGRIARLLKATSDFGAQLDSLVDFVNFGVVPSILLYYWSLNSIKIKGIGWAIALFFAICTIIRLARFNVVNSKISALSEDKKTFLKKYFIGIPAPAGAVLSLIPIILTFDYKINFFIDHSIFLGGFVIIIALMMASNIPTFSFKDIKIRSKHYSKMLILCTIVIISILMKPWIVIPIYAIIYVLSIAISIYFFYYKNHKIRKGFEL